MNALNFPFSVTWHGIKKGINVGCTAHVCFVKKFQGPIEFYLAYAFHFVLLFCVFCRFLEMYQSIGCYMSIKIKSHVNTWYSNFEQYLVQWYTLFKSRIICSLSPDLTCHMNQIFFFLLFLLILCPIKVQVK
jgi:hypothetical protein